MRTSKKKIHDFPIPTCSSAPRYSNRRDRGLSLLAIETVARSIVSVVNAAVKMSRARASLYQAGFDVYGQKKKAFRYTYIYAANRRESLSCARRPLVLLGTDPRLIALTDLAHRPWLSISSGYGN